MDRDETRLTISREAASLFLTQGVAGTSGDDIAAAVGMSTRTIWRHFRNKESCVEPVLEVTIARFARILRQWPLSMSLENHLRVALPLDGETPQAISDGILAVRLVALVSSEPDIRTAWLNSYHQLELDLRPIIGERANRSTLDFDVKLCAATVMIAIRAVDESISLAAVNAGRSYSPEELVDFLAGAIRRAATLPICDAITIDAYR
jgi:AcrR family transcriptional regulator